MGPQAEGAISWNSIEVGLAFPGFLPEKRAGNGTICELVTVIGLDPGHDPLLGISQNDFSWQEGVP